MTDNTMREAMNQEFDQLVYEWFQESTIHHHIKEDGRHIAERARFVAEKAAEWGAKWQSQQAQGAEGWTEDHSRVASLALWKLINEGYSRANTCYQKGSTGTVEDGNKLLRDVKLAEEGRTLLAALPAEPDKDGDIV